MVGALLDSIKGKPRVLDMNTFLVEGVHQVVFHRAVQEDFLSDQRLSIIAQMISFPSPCLQ